MHASIGAPVMDLLTGDARHAVKSVGDACAHQFEVATIAAHSLVLLSTSAVAIESDERALATSCGQLLGMLVEKGLEDDSFRRRLANSFPLIRLF